MGHYNVTHVINIAAPTQQAARTALAGISGPVGECEYSEMCHAALYAVRNMPVAPKVYDNQWDATEAARSLGRSGRDEAAAIFQDRTQASRTETVEAPVTDKAMTEAIGDGGHRAADKAMEVLKAAVQPKADRLAKPNERAVIRSVTLKADANTISGGRTEGTAVTVYDLAIDAIGAGSHHDTVRRTFDTQAEATAFAKDWMGSRPQYLATANITARVIRRAPQADSAAVVSLRSRPRRMTAIAEIDYIATGGPAKLVLVGDCHH